MRAVSLLLLTCLVLPALAGCMDENPSNDTTPATYGPTPYVDMGFDGETWPRLDGTTLTVLSHSSFGGFKQAKEAFEELTGATVVLVTAGDSGSVLNRAVQERGNPTFDVVYGIDNILYARAVEGGIYEPYRPLLAERIAEAHVFFGADATWHATPVDHGYIAINWDPQHDGLEGATIETLDDVRAHAGSFVTQDPRTSTPGLGFLLATIATYPEDAEYTWHDYWRDLFAGGVLVTSGWTEAYEQHFSAGYGIYYGGQADKPIVTSYTTSPAYEHYYERPAEDLALVVTAPQSTFHQVQTMGIAKGTPHLAAAQAWIEFTLTDAFQAIAAPHNAIYPVVEGVEVESTYAGVDPAPGTFTPAGLDFETIGVNLEGWIRTWVDLCEAADCA